MISYLPLLLIPIVVIGLITRGVTEYGLTVLVTNEAERRATTLAWRFNDYYVRNNQSWDGIAVIFDEPYFRQANPVVGGKPGQFGQPYPPLRPTRPPNGKKSDNDAQPTLVPQPFGAAPPLIDAPEQIILADVRGVVIAANNTTGEPITGQTLSPDTLARGVPIYFEGKAVGVLVIGAALGVLDQAQRQILDNIYRALFVSGILSGLAALALGLWLSGRLSAPVAALMAGVRGLGAGKWVPVPAQGTNELADLTRAFNQMGEDLTRQQALRKQLVADIAHDLRTPLSVMTLEIAGIKDGLQTPEEAAQSLQDEVTWLSRLVEDLHTLSLIDAHAFPIQTEPTDLTLFMESVYRHWRTVADREGRTLCLELAPDLPIVSIDPPRMRQVLGNLIGNAMQHTPPDALVTLRAERGDSTTQDKVRIQVIDRGQGIPADVLPHLFERLYRMDKSRKRVRKSTSGSGLGLSIAFQLTALQQGRLTVQSEGGKGTAFTVTL